VVTRLGAIVRDRRRFHTMGFRPCASKPEPVMRFRAGSALARFRCASNGNLDSSSRWC
jgi:hypothetical protein